MLNHMLYKFHIQELQLCFKAQLARDYKEILLFPTMPSRSCQEGYGIDIF